MNKSTVKEKNLESLYRWRELIDKERIEIANSFDKYLLTFATGTLYLSVLFTSSIKNVITLKFLLGVGWIFLIISVVFTLLSIFLSEHAFYAEIGNIDSMIREIDSDKETTGKKNCWNYILYFFQIIGIGAFIAGVIFLSIAYYVNLK